jgi:hypothetical protein
MQNLLLILVELFVFLSLFMIAVAVLSHGVLVHNQTHT